MPVYEASTFSITQKREHIKLSNVFREVRKLIKEDDDAGSEELVTCIKQVITNTEAYSPS